MNAEVEAVTAEDCEMKDSQSTGVTHATPMKVLQTRQRCVSKAEVCIKDQDYLDKETKMKGF